MHRLFVALRPSLTLRQLLLDAMGGIAGARWQRDDQLHLTLRFIGEVERPVAEDIAVALGGIDHPAPSLSLSGVGTFDRKGVVHTLWAGVAADENLRRLRGRINRSLQSVGIAPDERAFHPHVTLARMGREAGDIHPFLVRTASLAGGPERVDAFILYESRLGRDGASYEPVARYPLN